MPAGDNINASLSGEESGVGRPSKCTPQLLCEIVDAIDDGLTDTKACQLVDIHVDTLHEWKNNNKAFSEALSKARIKRERRMLSEAYNDPSKVKFVSWYFPTHPDTREDYQPPTIKQEQTLKGDKDNLKGLLEQWRSTGVTPTPQIQDVASTNTS